MEWRLWDARRLKRMAILVSREEHCLLDLLWRWRRGELEAEAVLVASNHEDLRGSVESFGIPYHHVPVNPEDKATAEGQLLELLTGQLRLGGPGPVHADPFRGLSGADGRAADQHPPLVPTRLRRRGAVRASQGAVV